MQVIFFCLNTLFVAIFLSVTAGCYRIEQKISPPFSATAYFLYESRYPQRYTKCYFAERIYIKFNDII